MEENNGIGCQVILAIIAFVGFGLLGIALLSSF